MLLYLNCKKIEKVKTWGLQRQVKENQCFYQNEQCMIVKNWDLDNGLMSSL